VLIADVEIAIQLPQARIDRAERIASLRPRQPGGCKD
jgi:hypothetical protein